MDVSAIYHPSYAEHAVEWQAIEDVCAGGRKVKSKGETYLPKLDGETPDEYRNRKFRAVFFNATKRTREALVGMLMRKPAKVTVPTSTELLTGDIDLEGATVKNWIRTVAQQTVSTGRSVTIADWSDEESRPYLAFYPATEVVNWATRRIMGRTKLSLLTLRETVEEAIDATVTIVYQFREYFLDEATGNTVWVKVWKIGGEGKLQDEPAKQLVKNGKPLIEIPAVFHNASHLGPDIGEAPLGDVADLNLAHYNGSADLENGRHICGIPTPYATGCDADVELKLGSTKAWTTTDAQAKFGFIEFQGAGLKELVTGQEEKERQMAVLGARLLFDNKKDAESYETVRLRSVAETATLSNMSGYLTATLSQALRWLVWWTTPTAVLPSDLPPDVGVVVNDDFVDTPLDQGMLTALTSALQGNAISIDTFFHQLEKGEIYPPDWDLQKEVAAIAARPPAMAPPAPPAPKVDPNADPNADPKPPAV